MVPAILFLFSRSIINQLLGLGTYCLIRRIPTVKFQVVDHQPLLNRIKIFEKITAVLDHGFQIASLTTKVIQDFSLRRNDRQVKN